MARIAAEQKAQEEAARNAIIVSANGYRSKPAAGFNVTTGNRLIVYQMVSLLF